MRQLGEMTLPGRRLPVLAEADCVVLGGGSAGVSAAVAAARLGVSVVLLERDGCAGGMMTAGVLPCVIHMGDGKRLLSGGLCYEMLKRVAEEMKVELNIYWQNIHPEIVKLVLDRMLQESGVHFLYGVHGYDVIREGEELQAVAVSTPGGPGVVKGRIFVDATGDGVLSQLAGVPWEIGDEFGEVMAPTLCALWSGVRYEELPEGERYAGMGRREWHQLQDAGKIPVDEHHFVGFFRCGSGVGIANLGHEYGCRPLDADSYTEGCVQGRERIREFLRFFQERVPGFREAEVTHTASRLGVRESRRIQCDYRLTSGDYYARRHFPDEIGCFAYPVDMHATSSEAAAQSNVEKVCTTTAYAPGENYGIPYRTLLASGIRNLLVAGRCVSADRVMQSSLRVVPGCMITGEAAGSAAAMAVKNGCTLRQLDVQALRAHLRTAGIYLP